MLLVMSVVVVVVVAGAGADLMRNHWKDLYSASFDDVVSLVRLI